MTEPQYGHAEFDNWVHDSFTETIYEGSSTIIEWSGETIRECLWDAFQAGVKVGLDINY